MKKKDLIVPAKQKSDEYYMKKAIAHAEKAAKNGEVPVGAVIVYKGRIIASAANEREQKKDALCHAEISAIRKACKRMGGWRLCDCDMYVTLEPCPMCAGALINSRMRKVIIGARDVRFGCFGGSVDFNALDFNHTPEIEFGICEEKCSSLMTGFFEALRAKRNKK